MLTDALLVAVGLLLLVAGGEALVRGACGIALLSRVRPAVVGLTIVAAGTSMPELVVTVQSAAKGSPGLALGNVVGSNVFNVAFILGVTAMVRPLVVQGNTVRLEWPVMLLAALQLHLLARDGTVDRLEGGVLLAALIVFVVYVVWIARKHVTPVERDEFAAVLTAAPGRSGSRAWMLNGAAVVVGVALLAGGSTVLVRGAAALATALGVSETVVGLTIVAAGTSTPELVTSLVAAFRGRADVAVGNVVGSNVFNVLGIVGTTALVHPVPVPQEIVARDDWWMIGLTLALFPILRSGMRVVRWEGALLVTAYVGYVVVLLTGAR